MDLDYMDMLEKAADEEEFRMLGVTDAPPLEQRQVDAAQNYIDALSSYISSANSQNKQALDDAKQKLVELDVSRSQVESVTNFRFPEGIDASKGIEGVFGPSIGGAVKQGYENLIDLYGTGALQALGSVIELAGGDKELALGDTKVGVNPIGPGVSYIFGDDGKVRTTPLGQTKTGTPVVLTGPIGAAGAIGGDILRGDAGIFDIPEAIVDAVGGAAGVVQTAANAGVLGLGDDSREEGGDVFLDEEAILASILGDDDKQRADSNATQRADAADTVVANAETSTPTKTDSSLPSAELPAITRTSLPGAEVPVTRTSLPTAELPAVTRTSLPEAVVADILASEKTDPTRTALSEPPKTSAEVAAAGGGDEDGGGTTAPSGGIRTVSGGPAYSIWWPRPQCRHRLFIRLCKRLRTTFSGYRRRGRRHSKSRRGWYDRRHRRF
jgi:hypothetical protein